MNLRRYFFIILINLEALEYLFLRVGQAELLIQETHVVVEALVAVRNH